MVAGRRSLVACDRWLDDEDHPLLLAVKCGGEFQGGRPLDHSSGQPVDLVLPILFGAMVIGFLLDALVRHALMGGPVRDGGAWCLG